MKKKIILGSILVVIALVSLFLYPIVKEKIELKKLVNEIEIVNDYLINRKLKKEVDNYIEKDITTSKRWNVEQALDYYLSDVLENIDEYKKIKKEDYSLSVEKINKKTELEDIKKKINTVKDTLSKIEENKDSYLEVKGDYEISLYHSLVEKIDFQNYYQGMDDILSDIDKNIEVVNYLEKKKNDYKIEDNTILFLNKNIFNEYKKLNNKLSFRLIEDKTSPKINASDISIYKGTKINLKDKIKCVDEVDGNIECKISGNYDINKIGTYPISISSCDMEGNTAKKSIKLIVKEKVVSKNPYYIEVIRNHNIVVVYGLDSNNEYKRIIKVFICSVGLNGKTPTGTFKTSDKSSWGWLVGNVYGQYYTRITGSILFHSVPYFKKAKNQLEWEEYNKLGTSASKGCVRLTVRDAKWIYDNCKKGTSVKIYDGNIPQGVSKPSSIKIDSSSPNKGWDPTDPDPNNPWNK